MIRKYSKVLTTGLAGVLVALAILSAGCASTREITGTYNYGRILLLPPRDVVQNAVPHQKGNGSGQVFQNYLRLRLTGTAFEILTTDNTAFNSNEIAKKKEALNEAKRLGANYCLQIILGEFLDAAPMTFRPDYVRLEKAVMWDAKTGEVVWEFLQPLELQTGNTGSYHSLLDAHARNIAKSILKNVK